MQVDIADVGNLRKQLTISFTADEFNRRQDELLRRYAGQANIKGFRSGRAPMAVIRKRYGEAVRAETMEQMLGKGVQDAMRDNDLHAIGPFEGEQPDTSDGLRYTTSFDIRPDINLPDPKDLSVTMEDTTPSDEEVQEEIDAMLRRAGNMRPLADDDQLQQDDSVTLSGRVTAGDETIREVQDLNHVLGAYPLFGKPAEEVMGMIEGQGVGAVLEFDTELPDTFRPEEWAGKQAHVAVTVQQAQRLIPAELGSDLFERFGVEDEAAFRERVVDSLRQRGESAQHRAQTEQLTEQLIDKTEFDLPEKLLQDVVENHLEQAVQRAQQQDEAADPDVIRKDEEGAARERAERFLRRHLILDTIADQHQIDATREDLQQQIMMAAYQSGQRPEDIVQYLQDSGQIHQVRSEIREAKALEHFLQLVRGDTEEEAETVPANAETGDESQS